MKSEIQITKEFNFKKGQIESFLKGEVKRKFRGKSKISIRKRRKFIDETTRKVGKKFGKDVLCLFDFSKNGFVSLVSPAHTRSTDKGKLFQSFAHPQVFYTSHCVDRFSQRMETEENCIAVLDSFLAQAMITYGMHDGYLPGPEGVFACNLEDETLIIKTFINYELLTDNQIREFYTPDALSLFKQGMMAENVGDSDFIMAEELPCLPESS